MVKTNGGVAVGDKVLPFVIRGGSLSDNGEPLVLPPTVLPGFERGEIIAVLRDTSSNTQRDRWSRPTAAAYKPSPRNGDAFCVTQFPFMMLAISGALAPLHRYSFCGVFRHLNPGRSACPIGSGGAQPPRAKRTNKRRRETFE